MKGKDKPMNDDKKLLKMHEDASNGHDLELQKP